MAAYKAIEYLRNAISVTRTWVTEIEGLNTRTVEANLDAAETNAGIISDVVQAAAKVWETHGHTEWCPIREDATKQCTCGIDKLTDALHRARGGTQAIRTPSGPARRT